MRRHWLPVHVLSTLLLVVPCVAHGELKLPSILGDNMVLQREANVPIWGWADAGQKVTVSLDGQVASTVTGANGKWLLHLKDLRMGGPYEMTVQAGTTLVVRNILVGDVWLCSGQSNMQANMGWLAPRQDRLTADHPEIRLFLTPIWLSPEPLEDVQGEWLVCSPKSVGAFSAVGYYFGRKIQQTLAIPVGLICSASGGSTAQTWMSAEAFAGKNLPGAPDGPPQEYRKGFYQKLREFREALDAWEAGAAVPGVDLKSLPPKPKSPLMGLGYPAVGSFNAMIAPLQSFAIRGVIWYQGEANTDSPDQYARILEALIEDWRQFFGNPELPFLQVQLAAFIPDNVRPGNWAALREQQNLVARKVRNVGMAVALDVGDPKDIHPRNKKPVGERLALLALRQVYGKDLVSSGPVYEPMTVEGSSIRLSFREAGAGLMPREGDFLQGFQVAGADRVFVQADALIDGRQIRVSARGVDHPVAVRYAWSDCPECNLVNKEGLPAGPFRTDDWSLR